MEATASNASNATSTTTSIWTDQVPQTKLIASLVLFLITLLCGYLPVKILLNQDYVQHAMFAGGGVLMATAFCHLIPEAHDNYKTSVSAAAAAAGLGPHHQHQHHQLHQHSHNHDHDHQVLTTPTPTTTTTPTLVNSTTSLLHNNTAMQQLIATNTATGGSWFGPLGDHLQGLNVPYIEITLCCGFFFMFLVEQLMIRFINNHTHEHPCGDPTAIRGPLVVCGDGGGGGGGGGDSTAGTSVGNLSTSYINPGSSGQSTTSSSAAGGGGGATELYKFIRGLLIVSAFGAHAIFDGVAIGSQETVDKVWTIFLAISCHKLIIAAVVGLELFAATLESHLWTLVHLAVFSAMSPIGIILVVVAQDRLHLDSNHPGMILLQSFATGTLLYIIFVEILQPKAEDPMAEKNRLSRSFSLIVGFALMLVVLTVIDEH